MSMHHTLFNQVMNKASSDLRDRGISSISRERMVEEAALYITYSTPFLADELAMLRYWETLDKDPQFYIPDNDLIEGMARYLGHADFQGWAAKKQTSPTKAPQKRIMIVLVVAVALVLVIAGVVAVFLMGTA